jgi:uncharacterized membrane protein
MKQPSGPVTSGVDETVESIAQLEQRALEELSSHQRWIERVTAAIGQPRTVYIVALFLIGWIGANLLLRTAGKAFDPPPFPWLQGIVSLSALFMTIFILTTGNRLAQHDLRHDRLDLQINLLTERKISKVIEMLEAMRRDSPGIPDRHDPQASVMRNAIDPHEVVRALDEHVND